MNVKKVYFILLGLAALTGILAIVGVTTGNKLMIKSAQNLNNLKLETSVLDEQQNSLTRARQDIEKYADLEVIAKTVVPQEKDQARTIRELVKLARDTGVPLTSITFPASDLGQKKTTKSGSSSSSTTKKSSSVPPLSQLKEVEGLKGVYQLEITIANDDSNPVTYSALINFLKKLEQNRRTSQVATIGLEPLANNRNLLTYNMTLNVYIKPDKS